VDGEVGLTLREERKLREFKNRVLRKVFDCQRQKVMGGWRKLLNEVHDLYFD
jgi:hypothetical protein